MWYCGSLWYIYQNTAPRLLSTARCLTWECLTWCRSWICIISGSFSSPSRVLHVSACYSRAGVFYVLLPATFLCLAFTFLSKDVTICMNHEVAPFSCEREIFIGRVNSPDRLGFSRERGEFRLHGGLFGLRHSWVSMFAATFPYTHSLHSIWYSFVLTFYNCVRCSLYMLVNRGVRFHVGCGGRISEQRLAMQFDHVSMVMWFEKVYIDALS